MKVYSGRFFSDAEIDRIRQWIREDPSLKRTPLSRKICQSFGWVKPNGTLTALSCRMALLRMERDGLFEKFPVVLGLVLPVGGVLFRSGRQISVGST